VTSFGRLLSSKYQSIPRSEHLVSAIILDSSPAIGNFRSIGMAFSIAIRNPLVRYIALALIYLSHALRLSLQMVFGIETMGTRYLKALLNPRLLPWMNSQTPRLYVFSKKDELVPWQAVQQHAEAAKTSGLNVRYEIYEESAHVAHMRLDPKRYWASIQDLWQIACHESQVKAIEVA
jgi:pimeloyl-ACP methyl ester carboxylesterase